MITKNAKRIINIIALEHSIHVSRALLGHIKTHHVIGCTIECLATKARGDVDLRTFLETMAFIPENEDSRSDVEWAEDRREPKDHVVNTKLAQPENVRPDPDETHEHPLPNERIC